MAYTKSTLRQVWSRISSESPFTGSSSQTFHSDLVNVKSGSSIPRYRSVIKSGGIASSVYAITDVLNESASKINPYGFSVRVTLKDFNKTQVTESSAGTYNVNLPIPVSQDFTETTNLALAKFYKRLAAEQTQFNGMQFLGELHETITLFKHPFRTSRALVDKYMSTVRENALRYRPRQSLPGRRKFEKAIADSWLEVAFGIKPLLSDVADAAKAAKQFLYDNKKRTRLTSTVEVPLAKTTNSFLGATSTVFITLKVTEIYSGTHSVKFIGGCDWSRQAAPEGSFERLRELTGFRADLFVPTLYELAPWSFLVDYFTNLGTIIETGCQSTSAITFVVKCERAKSMLDTTVEGQVGSAYDDFAREIVGSAIGTSQLVRSSFYRTPLGATIPTVPFKFSLPGSPTKYVNMLALWKSKTKGV